MGTRTLIGTGPPARYTARWLHWGAEPGQLVPTLRRMWQDTFGQDTTALVTTLLTHDWSHLTTTPNPDPHGGRAVAGVGTTSPGGTGPLRHGRTDETVSPDREWLYLIDTVRDTVRAYEATRRRRWLAHSTHSLHTGQSRAAIDPIGPRIPPARIPW